MPRQKNVGSTGFAQRVRAIRKSRRRTQAELCKELGISVSTYSQIERGVHEPSWPIVLQIASFFRLPIDAFKVPDRHEAATGATLHDEVTSATAT